MKEKYYVTKQGLEDLKEELNTLVNVTREEVIEELKAARAQGDLSENADYDVAKDRQAKVEARIKEVEDIINNASIIENTKSNKTVKIGNTVVIKELDSNQEVTYQIVGSVEADPINGKISNATPLAEAIINHKINDVCKVNVANPYEVQIIKIS